MWRLIVGAFIGSWGAKLAKRTSPGCLMNILSGIVGSYVGHFILGEWGPRLAGMALIPSIIGAAIVTSLVEYLAGRR